MLKARAAIAEAARRCPDDTDARRALTFAKAERAIRAALAAEPALTGELRGRLAAFIAGDARRARRRSSLTMRLPCGCATALGRTAPPWRRRARR